MLQCHHVHMKLVNRRSNGQQAAGCSLNVPLAGFDMLFTTRRTTHTSRVTQTERCIVEENGKKVTERTTT